MGIMIKNVRCNFPQVFSEPVINGEVGKRGIKLLIEKKDPQVKAIRAAIQECADERLKGKLPPADKLCLRDGADMGREEYDGYFVLSASSKNQPPVFKEDGRPFERAEIEAIVAGEEEDPFYSGCRVNAMISVWGQDNKYGKRVNASLDGVQFAGDDDRLDGGVSKASVYEAFGATMSSGSTEGDEDYEAAFG